MEVDIDIESLHRENCARNIERYLRTRPGIERAAVDYDAGYAVVTADAEVDVDS